MFYHRDRGGPNALRSQASHLHNGGSFHAGGPRGHAWKIAATTALSRLPTNIAGDAAPGSAAPGSLRFASNSRSSPDLPAAPGSRRARRGTHGGTCSWRESCSSSGTYGFLQVRGAVLPEVASPGGGPLMVGGSNRVSTGRWCDVQTTSRSGGYLGQPPGVRHAGTVRQRDR